MITPPRLAELCDHCVVCYSVIRSLYCSVCEQHDSRTRSDVDQTWYMAWWARGDLVQVIDFWCWSARGCGSTISFVYFLWHFAMGILYDICPTWRQCNGLVGVCALWMLSFINHCAVFVCINLLHSCMMIQHYIDQLLGWLLIGTWMPEWHVDILLLLLLLLLMMMMKAMKANWPQHVRSACATHARWPAVPAGDRLNRTLDKTP